MQSPSICFTEYKQKYFVSVSQFFVLSDSQGKNEESVQLDFNLKRFNFETIFKSIFKFIGTIFGPIFFIMEMIFRSIFNFIGTIFGTIFGSIFPFITI